MSWYYVEGNNHIGPLDDNQLQALADEGKINSETLVWNEDLPQWMPYGDVGIGGPLYVPPSQPSTEQTQTPQTPPKITRCSACGNIFPEERMVQVGESLICTHCNSIFNQKIEETTPQTSVQYGGFWTRLCAKLIDELIVVSVPLILWIFLRSKFELYQTTTLILAYVFISLLILLFIDMVFTRYFIGKYASTPGKMVCGIKVVTADGGKLSHELASKRSLAEVLSAAIFFIGYIMAAFDKEKRTLHDRICNTRVIKR